MTKKTNANQYEIKVVGKAVRVLRVLSDSVPRTLTEISQELDINISTTFRLLATLTNHNFLQLDDSTGKYRLGLACLELARAYQTENELLRAAQPELENLRNATKETVHLAALDGMEIIYLEKLESLYAIGLMSSRVGKRAPAHCTGVGKALLSHVDPEIIQASVHDNSLKRFNEKTIVEADELIAHLKETRSRGYALDEGEHEDEVRCVAAPIFDRTREVIAAVSVSGPRSRMDPVGENEKLIKLTLQAAHEISTSLGYTPD